MLVRLYIQNYAVIDEISIEFKSGLQVITGETGAGKSIIAGALSLVLGDRADSSVLKFRDKKSIVEAVFQLNATGGAEKFLVDQDLDKESELIVRREISSNGKSRAFINDTPVNLDQMKSLGAFLVDLHQQFDTLSLGESAFQLGIIDALAGNSALLAQYQNMYGQFKKTTVLLEQYKMDRLNAEKENDYFEFLYNELDEAGLKENEFENAELLLKKQSHAEAIRAVLTSIYSNMELSERPVVQQIRLFSQQLEPYKSYDPKFPELLNRLSSVYIELQDIATDIESISENVQSNAEELESLNERVHLGYKLFKKHNVTTTTDLIKLRDGLKKQISDTIHLGERIQETEKALEKLQKETTAIAGQISVKRKSVIEGMQNQVNVLLKKVGMPNARFQVQCSASPLSERGMDQIDFLFDANKSNRFEPLRKVASGGELSRLMLCVKSLVAESMDMPTLLFDEIDAGISGEAARQVGIILKELSSRRQVICITHQPQIAGKGDAHFYVYKELEKDTVRTSIKLLDNESRITIIAKMLSGEKPTAAALENARELVN